MTWWRYADSKSGVAKWSGYRNGHEGSRGWTEWSFVPDDAGIAVAGGETRMSDVPSTEEDPDTEDPEEGEDE
jgi:hypothetical protein